MDATDRLNSAFEASLDNVINKYKNGVDQIFDKYER